MSRQTTALVVSRRVLSEAKAFPELLRVHMAQHFGIDYRSPRVKVSAFKRVVKECGTVAFVTLAVTVWYPGGGDMRRIGHYVWNADEGDSLFWNLVDFDLE